MNMLPAALHIRSGQGDYSVDFLESVNALAAAIMRLPSCVVLVDANIARLYAAQLAPVFDSRPTHRIDATEDVKTPDGVLQTLEFFQNANAVKGTPVVAIGGGIVQDIATFAAHVYYRGLRWFYAPTTLLGMSDSCIGAKCGINFGRYKNQLGVFHSPAQVWICLGFLDTLADTEIRSGYGEIVKLHLTRSGSVLFDNLRQTVMRDGLRNPQLAGFIRTSLEVKKGVIEEDEYERDLRRILNYGHTFGHALEAVTDHAIPHGLAVAWGIDLVNFLAWREGLLAEADFHVVHDFLRAHFSWKLPRGVSADELLDGTRRDKKMAEGKINLILPERPGALRIVPHAYTAELRKNVADYLADWNVLSSD